MFPTGLSATDFNALCAAFGKNHRLRRSVQILDLNHNLVVDITGSFNDGQVNIDSAADISRSATVTMFDPTHAIGLDGANPGAGTVAPTYMLRLTLSIYVDALATPGWVEIPVFTGPITRPSRSGDLLTIEAQGKEYLSQDKAWVTMVKKKGMNKITAIQELMAQSTGETLFRFPATDATLLADVNLTRDDTPWSIALSIANGMGRTFYYDGAGYLVCAPKSTTPVFTFTTGMGGTVLDAAAIGNNEADTYNLVYVTGGTPSSGSTPVTGYAVAADNHPLSPRNLGRNGVPRYKRYDVTDDSIVKAADATALAVADLPGMLTQSTSVAFNSMPVWFLEESDFYTLVDDVSGYTIQSAVSQMSIPMTCAGSQSNGSHQLVSVPLRNIGRVAA